MHEFNASVAEYSGYYGMGIIIAELWAWGPANNWIVSFIALDAPFVKNILSGSLGKPSRFSINWATSSRIDAKPLEWVYAPSPVGFFYMNNLALSITGAVKPIFIKSDSDAFSKCGAMQSEIKSRVNFI